MLRSTDVAGKTVRIVAGYFKRVPAEIGLDTRLREDLGGDSMDLIVLLFDLEQEFGIRIPDTDAAGLQTIGDAVRYLERAT
jgi:acyl carrier protein